MTGEDEAALHALSAEPRDARAGDTVTIRFRTRNVGTAPSPAGMVAFVLGDGLDPSGTLEVPVGAVAPGDEVTAAVEARVAPPAAERVEIGVRAALHAGDAVLPTNACTVVVHGRAVVDGPGSATTVEAIDSHRVRVRAAVTNEGDGPARDVRIVVPVPAGCVREDGRERETLEIARLEVAERAELCFEARIAAVVGVVRANDGVVELGDGRRLALPVRDGVVPRAVLLPPEVVVTSARRRAAVEIELRNDGWADADDVRVGVALPQGTKWIAESFTADGAPIGVRPRSGGAAAGHRGGCAALAHVERDGEGRVIVLSAVPARGVVRLGFAAAHEPGCADGVIAVRVGDHVVEAAFVPLRVRDVRVRVADAVRSVAPGETFAVSARVENAGDLSERLAFGISGIPFAEQAFASRMIPAGCGTEVTLEVVVPDGDHDATSFDAAFVATADDGEPARAPFELRVLRPIVCDSEDGAVGDIGRAAACRVRAELFVPETAVAGAPFGVRLAIDAHDALDTLEIGVGASGGAGYVPGTARLDDRVLLDATDVAASSPLEGDGLVLRAVPAGSRLILEWSLRSPHVADQTPVVVCARVRSDGELRLLESPPVALRSRETFAARARGTAYHVESCATAPVSWPGVPAEPQPPPFADDDAVHALDRELALADLPRPDVVPAVVPLRVVAEARPESLLRLGGERLDEIARIFAHARTKALVDHLFVIRFFFPDSVEAGAHIAGVLDVTRDAVRELFDRLYVKLRIPGFDVSADDLEDADVRRALIALFEQLAPCRADAADALGVLAEAPYGSPSVLRALLGLLSKRCEDDPAVGAALARYAGAIDDVLARYVGLPLEIFDDALAHHDDLALDDARAELLRALRPHLTPAALAC